ncbi:MAG: peptidylprolyl isomerase [Alphaproteobacteria bacterium]|nr:MAG: peptidylprolyl isomerase [Alphaproteobacteria bacterium]
MHQRYSATAVIAAAIVATALFAAPAVAAAAADETVIAIVNGDKIMKKDVMNAMKNLPVKGKETEKLFPLVVDEIINEKLIDEATTAAKINESDDFKKKLDALKANLAKQLYVEKVLKDKVSDAAVKAEYKKFKEENEGKQEVHARHLLVKTEEEAKQAIKDLDAGEKFDAVAKSRSSDAGSAANGGDLGWFAEEDMLPEFSKAAFKLKPGAYSKEPVQTKFGWHVIKVEQKRFREVPELAKVEPAIKQKLTQDAVRELILKLRSKAEIKMFDMNGKPLEFGKSEKSSKDDTAPEDKPAEEAPKE